MSRSSSSNNASNTSRSKQSTNTSSKSTKQKNSVDQMKYEIAGEFGVELGANATARENGPVGGEITKRLVNLAKNNMKEEQ